MKKLGIVLMASLIVLSSVQTSMAYTYYTDILGHWGEPYIEWATNEVGLFQGYDDGTFKPQNSITRAEFISILDRLLQIQDLESSELDSRFKLDYSDITENFWAYDNIYRLAYYLENKARKKVDLKLIFSGNSLRPNLPITRYEAGVLTSLVTSPPVKISDKSYKDLSTNLRFYEEIIELTSNDIVKGYGDNTFRPSNNITRAEAATIIKNAYKELEYLKIDRLHLKSLNEFNLNKDKPLFEYGSGASIQTDLDKNFMDAITTLDYISFVGHIPYAEQHLYDPDPIDTLWKLKNNDYYNIIGINYYLLYYDKSLVKERKAELIREALEHYKTIENLNNIKGTISLLELAKNIIKPEELTVFLENYINLIDNDNDKILASTLLAEMYLNNDEYRKALDIHKEILYLSDDIKLKSYLILNNAYLVYKNSESTVAIEYLNKSWNDIKIDIQYRSYKDEIDFLFTSMNKQLMIN